MGYCAKGMKIFWVNVDMPTKTCIMHTDECIYTKGMRETKLKGIGVLKRDGGVRHFCTDRGLLQTGVGTTRLWRSQRYMPVTTASIDYFANTSP